MNGVNDSPRVECSKSKEHGFHPADEQCPWCEPPKYRDDADMDEYRSQWYGNYYNYGG